MVDQVGGNFIDKYLNPLKKIGVKYDEVQGNKLQTVFFEKIDKNPDKQLSESEIADLTGATDLTENEAALNLMEQSGIKRDDIESILDFDSDSTIVVTTKENEGVRQVHTFEKNENEIRLAQSRILEGNEEAKVTYNTDGSKIVEKGQVKTTYDDKNRITSIETAKGMDVKVKVEYEYEGDSTVPSKQVTTNPDGTKTEQTENISNPNTTQATDEKENPDKVEGDTDSDSDADADNDNDPGNSPSATKREGPIYAKEGETFKQTAKRLGFEEGTPEYEAFAKANPKAAQKGWFNIGKEITIPDDLKDKLKDEAFGVDAAAEEQAYVNRAKSAGKADGYNDTNTQKKTLEKNTNWWSIAKQNLIDNGNPKPSYAQIFERIGVIMNLNEGKEPKAGVEITVPKSDAAAQPTAAAEPTAATQPTAPAQPTEAAAPTKPATEKPLDEQQKTMLKKLGFTDEEIAAGKEKIEEKLNKEIFPKMMDEIVPLFKNEEFAQTAKEPIKLAKIGLSALLNARLNPYSELKEKDSGDENTKILEAGDTEIEIKLENGEPKSITVKCKNPETGKDLTVTLEQGKITTKEGENSNTMNFKPEEFKFEEILKLLAPER